MCLKDILSNRPISLRVYFRPRRALTLCPQLYIGIQPGARFPARSADALPTTLYGHFTQAINRNRPISAEPWPAAVAGRGEGEVRAPRERPAVTWVSAGL